MGRFESQRRGDWAEQRALRLLRAAGWNRLSQRWHCRWGVMDLLLHTPQRLLLGDYLQKGLKSVHKCLLG